MDKILQSVRTGQVVILDRWHLQVVTSPDINTDNVEELQGVVKVRCLVVNRMFSVVWFVINYINYVCVCGD